MRPLNVDFVLVFLGCILGPASGTEPSSSASRADDSATTSAILGAVSSADDFTDDELVLLEKSAQVKPKHGNRSNTTKSSRKNMYYIQEEHRHGAALPVVIAIIVFLLLIGLGLICYLRRAKQGTKQAHNGVQSVHFSTVCSLLLLAANFIDCTLLTSLVPLTDELIGYFQVGRTWIGLLFCAKFAVQVILTPMTIKIVNRYGPRIVVCAGLAVEVLCALLYARSGHNYCIALAARAVQGLGSSAIAIGGQSLLVSIADGGDEGSLLGWATWGMALGVLLGPSLSGLIASVFGWHGMFGILAGITGLLLAAGVYLFFVAFPAQLRERLQGEQPTDNGDPVAHSTTGLGIILQKLAVWRILLPVFVYSFTLSMLEPVAPIWAVRKLQVDRLAELGLMWSALPLGLTVATPVAGTLADVRSKRYLMAFGMLVICLGLLGLATTARSSVFCFEVNLAFIGIGSAFQETPSLAAMATVLKKEGHAAGFGAWDMACCLGFLAGPIVGLSWGVSSQGAVFLFYLFAVCCALNFVHLAAWPLVERDTSAEQVSNGASSSWNYPGSSLNPISRTNGTNGPSSSWNDPGSSLNPSSSSNGTSTG